MTDSRKKLTIKKTEESPKKPVNQPIQKSRQNSKKWPLIGIPLIILIGVGGFWMFSIKQLNNEPPPVNNSIQVKKKAISKENPTIEKSPNSDSDDVYHFNLSHYLYDIKLLDEENTISQLLDSTPIHKEKKLQVANLFPGNALFKEGTKFLILAEKEYPEIPVLLILEENYNAYTVVSLKDSEPTKKVYPRSLKKNIIAKVIEIQDHAIADISKETHPDLTGRIENVLAWKTDINRLAPGDVLKVVYEELTYNKVFMGPGSLLALEWISKNENFKAVMLPNQKDEKGNDMFCTANGKPLRESFLRSPVKYGRITSRYNLKRMHPVFKKVKPHFGTDFGAPIGTPILSLSDGTVIEMSFKELNGNYIKIYHDKTYTSQYLHLSRFKSGITKGSRVRQGDVIGYVGATGKGITGPHVCLRLWRNGEQKDIIEEKFPITGSIKSYEASLFIENRDYYFSLLDEKNLEK